MIAAGRDGIDSIVRGIVRPATHALLQHSAACGGGAL
jgi:hypothetical protein